MKNGILHVDMNNFYASVETLYAPEYRDVPMAVAGDQESRRNIQTLMEDTGVLLDAVSGTAEALEKMTAGQIAHFAGLWAEFDRECDPGPWDGEAADEAKKDWSTRLMSAFSGVCSRLLALFRRRSGRGR